ncbi:MAG: LysR family transcriptional regulator [Cyclobacteriaceae bacterium]
MNYTLRQLEIFLKVAEKQSITKAAEELYLTQPAVSIQLKNFQDQFDIPLIEAVGRNIQVTDFGREIELASRRILSEVDEIRNKTLAYKGFLAGKLKVSVVSTAKYVMPYFLSGFLKQHPGIDLAMDVTNKGKVIRSLENNEVDFAMVSVLPEKLAVSRVELMRNKLYLVGRTDALEAGESINIKTLEKLPLIYREQGSATRQAMERFVSRTGVNASKTMELTSNEAVKQALLAGLGFSVMPMIGLKNEVINKDLRVVKMKGLPIITNWNLIWRKDKSFSPVANAYLEYVRSEKDQIMSDNFAWYESEEISK